MDIMKMQYSIESRDRRYVKGYGFLSFAKNIGKNLSKNISNYYSRKRVGSSKKSATDAIETTSKRTFQKTAEATGYLIANKIPDKITSKKSTTELHSKHLNSKELPQNETNNELPKKRYISPRERKQIIEERRLV